MTLCYPRRFNDDIPLAKANITTSQDYLFPLLFLNGFFSRETILYGYYFYGKMISLPKCDSDIAIYE